MMIYQMKMKKRKKGKKIYKKFNKEKGIIIVVDNSGIKMEIFNRSTKTVMMRIILLKHFRNRMES